MTNKTNIKVPKKYEHMVYQITYCPSAIYPYFVALKYPFLGTVEEDQCQLEGFKTQRDVLAFIRSARLVEEISK